MIEINIQTEPPHAELRKELPTLKCGEDKIYGSKVQILYIISLEFKYPR